MASRAPMRRERSRLAAPAGALGDSAITEKTLGIKPRFCAIAFKLSTDASGADSMVCMFCISFSTARLFIGYGNDVR